MRETAEIQMLNGKTIAGHFLEPFLPQTRKVVFEHEGNRLDLKLDEIIAIRFLGKRNDDPGTISSVEVLEELETKDGETLTVKVIPHQPSDKEGIGFYALPIYSTNNISKFFFTHGGILKRTQHRQIGDILQESGFISEIHLNEALEEQERLRKRRLGDVAAEVLQVPKDKVETAISKQKQTKSGERLQVGDILVAANLLTQQQLQAALDEQHMGAKKQLGQILLDRGIINEEQLLMALALKFRLHFIDLANITPDPEALENIPASLANKMQVIPLYYKDDNLVVAISDPTNASLADTLRFRTNRWVEMVVATPSQISDLIKRSYPELEPDADDMNNFDIDLSAVKGDDEDEDDATRLASGAEQTPIVKLVNRIIAEGVQQGASDIHILPTDKRLKVMLRVDGLLREHMQTNKRLHSSVIARIKIVAGMDISKHRIPQDGRIKSRINGQNIELRVSCMPGLYGEHIVLRILDTTQVTLDMQALGIEADDIADISAIVRSVHGMFLVTGPTGSGKSTTLMSVMQSLAGEPKHLLSLEDPIERSLTGINQMQINDKVGFSFASALRNVLRHDPDVIMVGEIRDGETANIAVEAALTGHVLISSLHTNTAAGAFDRLINMGVESYLVASTVKGVMAQQLVAKLCHNCRKQQEMDENTILFLKKHGIGAQIDNAFVPVGCDECKGTGYKGRVMLYEFLRVSDEIAHMIVAEKSEYEIFETAKQQGMRSMVDRGLEALQKGDITTAQFSTILVAQ